MIELLNSILKEQNLAPVSGEAADRFRSFAAMLREKNRVLNLTAIEEEENIVRRHFADSLMLFKGDFSGGKIIDIGCGGGFPGIPVKIYSDMLKIPVEITMLDATAKKIAFVEESAGKLGLSGVTPVAGRAEELIVALGRESFDGALSRAVSDMRIIAELALPFLRTGGKFYAWKTEKATPEVEAAEESCRILGGEYGDRICYPPFYIQTVKKIRHTPSGYPRPYAQIVKKAIKK